MPAASSSEPTWLSLEQAARRLNIHPATLREWADKGRIRVVRTPGGHRRFRESDVAGFHVQAKPDLSLLMHATVGQTRLTTSGGRLAGESWYARFDDEAKARQRELGMDLVQHLFAFLADPERSWKVEIQQLGQRYALLARDAGLTLGDTMRAFHLFEGLVGSSVDEGERANVGRSDLDENVRWFLNEVRVAMVESFS